MGQKIVLLIFSLLFVAAQIKMMMMTMFLERQHRKAKERKLRVLLPIQRVKAARLRVP